MNTNISEIEELRLLNLKLLHGRTSQYIAPTSESLVEALNAGGLKISKTRLSNLYLRKKPIGETLAHQIERALGVSYDWLSSDHSILFSMSTLDRELINGILSLPPQTKQLIVVLLRSCIESKEAQSTSPDIHHPPKTSADCRS